MSLPKHPVLSDSSTEPDSGSTQQILGLRFFDGSAREAVHAMIKTGGYLVAPAAPALVNLCYDAGYRRALLEADATLADSGLMVLLWKLFQGRDINRISGLAYLQQLLQCSDLREAGALFLVLPNESSRQKSAAWLEANGFQVPKENFYFAPRYKAEIGDQPLLSLMGRRKPRHVIIGLGGGNQERLGLYLRNQLPYRPAIHCVGAALGFITGDQHPIPDWADRLYLGWLLRLLRAPRLYLRRFWVAHELPGLIARYGRRLPPLREADGKLESRKAK